MRVLLTGATGFVGRTVTKRLKNDGHDICVLIRNVHKVNTLFPDGGLLIIPIDNSDWMRKVEEYNPDIVIHLAAYFTGKEDADSIKQLIDSNLLFTTELLNAVSKTTCRSFISTGTFTEYFRGNGELHPNNLYSATKSAERPILSYYQKRCGWKWFNIIVYSPYGRRNDSKKVIDYLIDAIGSKNPVPFSDGLQQLDFIHVDDMADFYSCLLNSIDSLPSQQEFHLGTGTPHSIKDVATILEEVFNVKVNADWGARSRNVYDTVYACAPISANIEMLGWQPKISLKDGLAILKKEIGGGVSV